MVASLQNGAEMLVYDSQGRYRESFGRSGEGPGEFREPGFGVLRPLPGGGVLVLDPLIRRITRMSATWEFESSTNLGGRYATNLMPLASGGGYVLARWGTTEESGRAEITEVIDLDGNLVETIAVVPTDDEMRSFFFSPLATDGEGRVWRALPTEYAVEAWDPADPGQRRSVGGAAQLVHAGPAAGGVPGGCPGGVGYHRVEARGRTSVDCDNRSGRQLERGRGRSRAVCAARSGEADGWGGRGD